MESQLGMTEARRDFSKLIERVQLQGDTFLILRHGKPVAALVPTQLYNNWKRQRIELFDTVREIQTEANLDPEEAARLATEAVAVVRSRSQSKTQ